MKETDTKGEIYKELLKVRKHDKEMIALVESLQKTVRRRQSENASLDLKLRKSRFNASKLLEEIEAHRLVLRREQLSDRIAIAVSQETIERFFNFDHTGDREQ